VFVYAGRDELMRRWWKARCGEIERLVLVVEGSASDEHLSGDGYFAAMGADPETGEPIRSTEWIGQDPRDARPRPRIR
jgi:hydrogenase small subunit